MKKQKTKFLLLFLITLFITISCGNSTKTTEVVVSEKDKTDDYAALKELNAEPQRIVEDLSGNVIVLTEKEFIERITAVDNPKGFQYLGQTPCIVEFYTDWCKPCVSLAKVLVEIAPEYKGKVIFYKLNIEKARDVSFAFNVESIPMILYFKPHKKISNTIGFLNREELRNTIDDLLLKP